MGRAQATTRECEGLMSQPGFYGNAGRNILRGPGAQDVDFSLSRNIPIAESVRFQFRLETFALFNRMNFGNPGATFVTSAFGNITGASGNRNVQLGGKLSV